MDRRRFLTGAGLFLAAGGLPLGRAQGRAPKAVSYTHLTLPTKA